MPVTISAPGSSGASGGRTVRRGPSIQTGVGRGEDDEGDREGGGRRQQSGERPGALPQRHQCVDDDRAPGGQGGVPPARLQDEGDPDGDGDPRRAGDPRRVALRSGAQRGQLPDGFLRGDHQHVVELDLLTGLAGQLLDAKHVARGDPVLLPTGLQNGEHPSSPPCRSRPAVPIRAFPAPRLEGHLGRRGPRGAMNENHRRTGPTVRRAVSSPVPRLSTPECAWRSGGCHRPVAARRDADPAAHRRREMRLAGEAAGIGDLGEPLTRVP